MTKLGSEGWDRVYKNSGREKRWIDAGENQCRGSGEEEDKKRTKNKGRRKRKKKEEREEGRRMILR